MAALERLTTRINIEMTGDTKRYLVSAKQGDKATRYIVAKLLNDGTAYTIPTGARVAFNARKPDGKHIYNLCDYSGSEVTVELTNQMLAAAGTAYCDIEVRTGDDAQIVTSASFTVEIEKSARNDRAILSANEFTELEDRVAGHIKMINDTDTAARQAEAARAISENGRVAAEENRVREEAARQRQELQRQQDVANAIKEAEVATAAADNAAQGFEITKQKTEEALKGMEAAAEAANSAAAAAEESVSTSSAKALEAASSALLSKSYSDGDTGIRDGEESDNSKYYSGRSQASADTAKEYLGRVEEAGDAAVQKVRDALDMDAPNFLVDLSTGHLMYEGGRFVFNVNGDGHLEWGLAV